MKRINQIILLISFLVITSCDFEDEDVIRNGFTFRIANRTNEAYIAAIVIGGFKNNNFIATDSINFERALEIGGSNLLSHFVDENRWKPSLDKIRNIPSNRCYFKLKLSNSREEMITRYNSSELMSLLLPNSNVFKGDFGAIYLNINDSQISGKAAEEN